MTIYSFRYLEHAPSDFGNNLQVKDGNIGMPARIKVTSTVPFSNETFDFSEVYGSQTYGERKITYVVNVIDPEMLNPRDMHALKASLVAWLESGSGKQPLWDDRVPGYHFLAEPQDALSLEDDFETGELTITFTAYTFMIADEPEGGDIWDTFDFNFGVAQETLFEVDGNATIVLVNTGATTAYPRITTSADMVLTVGTSEYSLVEGVSEGVALPKGASYISIAGSGTVSFEWYREVI